ncbi:B-cell lymphoma/leukemia 10 [Rhinophrynus dorsalis]
MAVMSSFKLSDDEMAEVKKDVIESLRHYLCDKIIAERHFDYLRSKKILNKDDTEEIVCQTTSRKKAGELLDRLAKNPKGLDALIESIRHIQTQDFLIEKITDEVLRAKNRRLDSCKGSSLSTYESTLNGSTQEVFRPYPTENKLSVPEIESTVLYHPEGESSLPIYFGTSQTSVNQSVLEKTITKSSRQSGLFSTKLPKPGEPGAPPLPAALPCAPEEVCSNSPIDSQFLPLRSSSLSNL